MAPSATEKAEKAEADALASLKLSLNVVETKLQEGEKAQLNARVVKNLVAKLEAGLNTYEIVITELIAVAGADEGRVEDLSKKLCQMMDRTNPLLDELFILQDTQKAADATPAPPPPTQRSLPTVQLKLRIAQKNLESRLKLLQDASKEEVTLASSPMIQTNLKELQDLETYSQSELDAILTKMEGSGLTDAEFTTFQQEVFDLIDIISEQISTLKDRFNRAAAALKKPEKEVTIPRTGGVVDTSLTDQIAREVASLRVDLESRSSNRSGSDFCFAKVQVPEFKGDVKEFTKWRSQVEDYLNEVARKSTEKASVHMLDRLTPRTIDVSRCNTLTEAWTKLSSKFGSPTHIARLLLRDFAACTLKKHTDEAKLIELRDLLEKLESDMITNGQQARLNDFTVLDQAEYMIPGRFRDQFVRSKDELVTKKGSGFKALTSFLEEEASMVERHLPDRLLDTEAETHQSDEDEIREIKAKLAALEGKTEQHEDNLAKSVKKKEASEKKAGKCPICDEYHYFKSTRAPSQGQDIASSCLHACPKYRAMTLDQKTDAIIAHKACAACTDWRHERPSCPSKADKPCREDGCTANHHTSLHGSKNPKVMALRTKTEVMSNTLHSNKSDCDNKESGLLAMLHIIFKEVKQGTIAFIDEGSETSAITAKLARALFLQGKIKLTTITKAFEKSGQTEPKTHHVVELTDRLGEKHEVSCMEVDYITEPQKQPDYTKVYEMFPHLPHGCLERPDMEVGLLLGQNATGLLPTGGADEDCVDNLRVRRSKLGEYGWVLEGRHPSLFFPSSRKLTTKSLRVTLNKVSVSIEADLRHAEQADPPTHTSVPHKVGDHIHHYLQSLKHSLPKTMRPPKSVTGKVVEANTMVNPTQPPTVADKERAVRVFPFLTHPLLKQLPDAAPAGKKKAKHPGHLWPPSEAPDKQVAPPPTSRLPHPNTGKPYRIPQRRGCPLQKSDPSSKIWGGRADLSRSSEPKDLEEFDMAAQRLILIHPHEAELLTGDDISQASAASKDD